MSRPMNSRMPLIQNNVASWLSRHVTSHANAANATVMAMAHRLLTTVTAMSAMTASSPHITADRACCSGLKTSSARKP